MKFHGMKCLLSLTALVAVMATQISVAEEAVDPALRIYSRTDAVKGKLTLIGSNTMSQVGAVWGSSFQRLYPDVEIDIQVKGSANAVGSVIDGSADIGLLSRSIHEDEVRAFHGKFGYVPTILTPVLEPQAIYVHKDNPIKSLSLSQLDAIFSKSLKRGAAKTAMTWGDVGVTGKWASAPITTHGRQPTTGSQVFFQSAVLGGGEFRADMVSHETNLDLIDTLGKDQRGIGFAGSTFDNPEIKAVPIAWRDGDQAFAIDSTSYPLTRRLQLVVNKHPGKPLNELQTEFIKYVFSQAGQQDVVISGFLPVPQGVAQISLEAVGEKTLN